MTIKQQGGIFGRNPSFNEVEANQVGIGLDDPKGALHVKLGTGYGAGNTWNTGSAVFGGEAVDDGALGLTYNNTDGSILASIIPLVSWKPVKVHASQFSVFVNGSTNVATVDGDGLKFNGDIAAANALSDYEEGSWTPALKGLTTEGAGTYSRQLGWYTKVGNVCHVTFSLVWSAHTGTGTMTMGGLPFNGAYYALNVQQAGTISDQNITLGSGNFLLCAVGNSSPNVSLYQQPTGGGSSSTMSVKTSGTISGQITYRTA